MIEIHFHRINKDNNYITDYVYYNISFYLYSDQMFRTDTELNILMHKRLFSSN